MTGEVAGESVRIAVYPGNLLHSGLVHPIFHFTEDVMKGRLTTNIFVGMD